MYLDNEAQFSLQFISGYTLQLFKIYFLSQACVIFVCNMLHIWQNSLLSIKFYTFPVCVCLLKESFSQKWKFCHHLLTLRSFQTFISWY